MAKREFRRIALTLTVVLMPTLGTFPGARLAGQETKKGGVRILYPPADSILPVGGYLQTYLAVETGSDALCRYANTDVGFEEMTPFTNSSVSRYHTHQVKTQTGQHYTFYVRCRDVNDYISSPALVSFRMADAPSGAVPNLLAVTTSPESVMLSWSDPTGGKIAQFNVYRDGRLVTRLPGAYKYYVDIGLQPSTLYRYAVSAGGSSESRSPEAIAVTLPEYTDNNPYPPAILDKFEEGLRVLNPASDARNRYLWQHACGDNSQRACSEGNLSITTEEARNGGTSLKYEMTDVVVGKAGQASSAYLRFRPMTDTDYVRHNAREFITSGTWKFDTYNRLRFRVKVPSAFGKEFHTGGKGDMNVGTYIRSSHGRQSRAGSEESGLGGGHYYHSFNIPYTGAWHEIVLDMHPSHGRSASPYIEWGNMAYPTGEKGFNYFDALTMFYIDFVGAGFYHALSKYPAEFYFADFEFYKDTNPENVEQVFSLNGVYAPAENRIYVGWSHPKNDTKTKYEVRYAFSDIYSLPNRWEDAKPAPKGTVSPDGGVYNLMEYSTTGIQVAGHDTVYVAIKPKNSNRFRQIALPVETQNSAHQQIGEGSGTVRFTKLDQTRMPRL